MSEVCLCKNGSRCERTSPPNIGTGYFQDKSLELWKNVSEFVGKHLRDNQERVFVTRLAMRPCVVLASGTLLKTFLEGDGVQDDYYNGLKDFFFGLFGPSVLFSDPGETRRLQALLLPLLASSSPNYDALLSESLSLWTASLPASPTLYNAFKELSLSFNLRLFLGVRRECSPELFDSLCALGTAHWHGIISVPLNVKLSFLASSSYRKAQEAKQQLLDLIEERLLSNQVPFLNALRDTGMELDLLKNHVLVFICALIPKGTASLLSSLIGTSELWHPRIVDPDTGTILSKEHLNHVLLECLRLWPPFVGGLRVAERDTELGRYHIPKGYGVFYVTLMAHRDPDVFPYPDEFLPDRWKTFNSGDRDKIFGFGAGLHKCPGEQLMWTFLMRVAETFIREFKWDLKGKDGTKKVKYLPVSRPAVLEETVLQRRSPPPSSSAELPI